MLRTISLLIAFLLFGIITNLLKAQPPQTTPWPEWVFYHWVWEDASNQQSAMQLVADYKQHGIPVGAINIDSRWETGYETFDWDSSLFPDPQAMIDSFHAQDIRVIVWITTMINTDVPALYHYADSMGYFMKQNASSGSAVVNWWKGDGSLIDFFNPAAVAWWKTQMDKVLDMGIDGWKCDGTDYSVLLGNATYSPGAGRTVSRLEYSHLYYRLFYDYTRQRLGDDRVIMSRPIDNYGLTFITDPNLVSFTPRDIGWACWVGDQDGTFAGMKNALNNMYQSDVNDYLVFGSDIGGYREDTVPHGRNKDLFIRWAQLGAFCPFMENGGGGEHRPWMFDEETTDIYRTFVKLHYALVPYLMEQSDSLYAANQSLMQFFNSTDYAFMLGSDIFVAPILSSSNNISVSFPAGSTSWVYLFDNAQVYQSGATASLTIPLGEYPVFVKASSPLLPTLDSVLNNSTAVEPLNAQHPTVTVYPNPAGSEFKISGLKLNADEEYEFRLFDMFGKNVLTAKLNGTQMKVSIEGLERGVYCYTIGNSLLNIIAARMTGKVVIQ